MIHGECNVSDRDALLCHNVTMLADALIQSDVHLTYGLEISSFLLAYSK